MSKRGKENHPHFDEDPKDTTEGYHGATVKWIPLRLQDVKDICERKGQEASKSLELPKRIQEVRQAYDLTLELAKVRPQSAPRLRRSYGQSDPDLARKARRQSQARRSVSQSSLRSDSQKENTQREVDFTELRGPWQVRVLKRSAVLRAQPLPDGRSTVDVPWILGRALKALQGPTWRLLLETCHHCDQHEMSTWHRPEEYEGAKDIVDETVRHQKTVELMSVHLPTPLLNQRLGACEVFLLPPAKAEVQSHPAVFYLLHSKLISRTWPTVKSLLWKLNHSMPSMDEAWRSALCRDKVKRSFSQFMVVSKAKQKFKAAGLLSRVEAALQQRRRSLSFLEEVLTSCREQQIDMQEPRVAKALDLYERLKRLRKELAVARAQKQLLELRDALNAAEELQFWDSEVVLAETSFTALLSEAQTALQRRDVQRLQVTLEGWLPRDWTPEDWSEGDSETYDLSPLKEAAERHVEWQGLVSSVRSAYKQVMSRDVPEMSHLQALRSSFQCCEAAKLRGLPAEEVDSWRHALQIFYERQVAQRRSSEPEVQRSQEDRVAAELFKALNATPIRLEHLEGALQMAEMEGAPICKITEEQEPWHLPRGLHRLAPLAAKHQRQLQKLRSRVEELLTTPTLELLDIPAEADSYEVAGSRRGFSDPSIEAARRICERGLSVRIQDRTLYMRLGARNDRLDRDVAGHPASVLVTLRRDPTLPEEQFTTDSNGCCFLPEGTEGIKVTLPNEPGLLPMNVSMCLLRRGWHREQLENDPQMLRALVLPGSGRCYLSLGGARSHFPSHGWQAAQLQLRLSSRLNVRCPYAGCAWTGHEGDLASHQLQCEEVRRIRRAVELRRNAARRDLWHLQVALSWCSEQSRSDLDMSIEHPCGKTVSYSRTQCLQCGAELDIDSTGAAGELALENITWPEAPPEGSYTVYVELFRGPKVSFHLLVQSNSGDNVRLFSHSSSFFDAGPRQVAATFQVTSSGIVFNPGACGLFRRAAYVSMLTRRLNSDVKAKASSAKAEHWDMSTDSDGWCRIGRNQKSLCIAPPKALGFELCLPVEVLCEDMPQEVMFPQKGPSGRRSSRQW